MKTQTLLASVAVFAPPDQPGGGAGQDEKTLTVEEAGRRYFGLCKVASYRAVKKGDIPIIRVGRLMRVPVFAMERMMMERRDEPKPELKPEPKPSSDPKPKKAAGKLDERVQA